ncbi:MAG: hypothetical protein NVS4B8_13070 [Herpetosiphon sp.]
MPVNNDLPLLQSYAQQIVHRRLGHHVVLGDGEIVAERSRSTVVRYRVYGWYAGHSIIVKHNTADDARGYTDLAGHQFLSTSAHAGTIAPRFYGADVEHRIFMMADLGASCCLEDVLNTGGDAAVVVALQLLAQTMARLVTTTSRHERRYEQIRHALPGTAGLGRRAEAERWLASGDKVHDWAAALKVPMPHGWTAACQYVAAVFAEPGPFLAFSHGDPAPTNNHIAGQQVRLLDFEYGAYRHALYDLTAWYVLCPLAEPWIGAMTRAFRSLLAATGLAIPVADDERFTEAWATMCIYRALAMLTWFPTDLLTADRAWTPGWSMRSALISTLLRLRDATTNVPRFKPFTQFGNALADAARMRWPDHGDGTLAWPSRPADSA